MMKQTGYLVILTLVLLFLIVRFGIPAIINMAVFLGDLKASGQPIGQTDTLAPAPPVLDQLPTATTSAKIDIRGYGESQTEVTLYRYGNELSESVIGDDGNFAFSDLPLEEGENSFYVVAIDSSGNESGQSNRVTILYDTTPPELTMATPLDGTQVYGELKRNIEVRGVTDPEAEVMINDYFSVVGSDGSFSTRLKLEEGDNIIVVIASDEAGNETKEEIHVRYSP